MWLLRLRVSCLSHLRVCHVLHTPTCNTDAVGLASCSRRAMASFSSYKLGSHLSNLGTRTPLDHLDHLDLWTRLDLTTQRPRNAQGQRHREGEARAREAPEPRGARGEPRARAPWRAWRARRAPPARVRAPAPRGVSRGWRLSN